MRLRLAILALALVAAAGCDYPRDAEGTLERVTGGVVRVGVAEHPPWVTLDHGEPEGIEPRLVRAFAAELGARVEWVHGSESALVHALEERRIDLVAAGLTRDTPWNKRGAPTVPYARVRIVVAAAPGAIPPADRSDLQGRTVAYRVERPDIAAQLRKAGATPEPMQRHGGALVAIYDFETGRLGLTPGEPVLAREEHILLAAPGESRFLMRLDEFLMKRGRQLALAERAP